MESSTRKIHTFADYERLPEGAPFQLIRGELIMTPSPTTYHQAILSRMSLELTLYTRQRKLGVVLFAPMDVYFSDIETYQPDIIFVSRERLKIIGERKIKGAPDLIMEILSPSTGYYDLTHKKSIYESSGVKEYWIVDPDERGIEVFKNTDGIFRQSGKWQREGKADSTLLTGFNLDLTMLFGEISA